jgi:hypothetical protein
VAGWAYPPLLDILGMPVMLVLFFLLAVGPPETSLWSAIQIFVGAAPVSTVRPVWVVRPDVVRR